MCVFIFQTETCVSLFQPKAKRVLQDIMCARLPVFTRNIGKISTSVRIDFLSWSKLLDVGQKEPTDENNIQSILKCQITPLKGILYLYISAFFIFLQIDISCNDILLLFMIAS